MFTRRTAVKLMAAAAVVGMVGLPELSFEDTYLNYKLGKTEARDAVTLKLRDYVDLSKLPAPPDNFGHETLVPNWQMLGNDTVGDCAIAGPFHAEMLWCAEGGGSVNVDTDCTLKAYSAITGYDPAQTGPDGSNPTDNGSDMAEVAEYWRATGLTDADGKVHKIDSYVALQPGNLDELWVALYLFDGLGIGVQFPEEWMTSFSAGQVWDALAKPTIEGGHYILGVGRRAGFVNTVTWGKTQLLTAKGYEQFNDETVAYFSAEKLVNGKDIDGFDADALLADLHDLADQPLCQMPCAVPEVPEVVEAEESFAEEQQKEVQKEGEADAAERPSFSFHFPQ